MHSLLKPNAWVVLRLPSDTLKVLQLVPNTIVSLGKYGTFSSNLIIERPYNLTYELLDRPRGQKDSDLRIVPASELHAETIAEENAASNPGADDKVIIGGDGVEFELVGENGEVILRSNRETIDDSARQTLTMEEIETLKREGTGAGKDLIAKLMLSHTALDQKTAFSLAKYKLLKTKKYLRRFTVLPLDVSMMTHWMLEERDAGKIFEMREEMLALVGCWANVHYSEENLPGADTSTTGGRWLIIDETGGLLVAAMAERMGILYPSEDSSSEEAESETKSNQPQQKHYTDDIQSTTATSNTLTLIHTNAQPNLSLLKYFNYLADNPDPSHPLATHLHTLSWLQLISPNLDTTYSSPPPTHTPEELAAMKSGKRGTYYRKRRRWERTKSIVNNTRLGSFSGLIIASSMDPTSILRHTVPLLAGGAPISIYSPTIEPLTALADLYSTSRRTAFIQAAPAELEEMTSKEREQWKGNEDFPLNPTLVLGASVQSSKVRRWQILPGRSHPEMTGRGGAEGYLFTGLKVLPAEGKVEARGKFKKRKLDEAKDGEREKESEDVKMEEAAEESIVEQEEEIKVQDS